MKIEEKIKFAKIAIIKTIPFFGILLIDKINIEVTKEKLEIGYAYTDNERIVLASSFVAKNKKEYVAGVLTHELLHIVFEHFRRLQDRNQMLWNVATDIAINNIIKLIFFINFYYFFY